ncbi:hypothetical protein GXN76_04815 [Kroppenstedtia pulmonis]|uniref:Uncharacterized protein n=1 Tax=Kroppenstedtia pulmonis TaxID=1380685 RepID=A0A7D3Y414_9BACL|nr:hypothetical protein [Kroppenstedtia pulmonis]QKG83865.1 hypothetical protein GXN76_04815 [Kroppenstedtia pulmonis]
MDWQSERRKIDSMIKEFRRQNVTNLNHYFDTHIRPYFEKRIEKIRPGLRGKSIDEKLWGDDGIVRRIFHKREDTKHGALGEFEFLQRKILIEKVPVEILPEKQNVKLKETSSHEKNPDFKLILKEKSKELITEVKSPTSDDIKRVGRLVKNANNQYKKSSLETEHTFPEKFKMFPGRTQGSLEIQYNDKHVAVLDEAGVKKIEEQIREEFSPNKHRGVVQVGVYRNHELVLELQRDRQNQIVKTYPVREQTKELAATDQRSQLDVLKEVVSDNREKSKEVQKVLNQGRELER